MTLIQSAPLDTAPPAEKKTVTLSQVSLFLLTLLIWSDRVLLWYARSIALRLPIIGSVVDILIAIVYIALVALAMPQILKRLKAIDIFFGAAVITISIVNLALFPDNNAVMAEFLPAFLLKVFSLYYIGLTLDFKTI